jgi:hypothetical protein
VESIFRKRIILLAVGILLISLACRLWDGMDGRINHAIYFGFDMESDTPQDTGGDHAASGHIFIHQYEIPEDGWVSGVLYLNDSEWFRAEIQESVTLLILRPTENGWIIVHAVELPADDQPIIRTGTSTVYFDDLLQVKKGDIYGHFQGDKPTGPFPLSIDKAAKDGLSVGKTGFVQADIKEGNYLPNEGFTGERDYYFNLIFQK